MPSLHYLDRLVSATLIILDILREPGERVEAELRSTPRGKFHEREIAQHLVVAAITRSWE